MGDRIQKFEDLEAWKTARGLVVAFYGLTLESELAKDFGLKGQIQRTAVSIMSNIAEGFERLSPAEKRQFYNVARASCGELRSLSYVIGDVQPRLAARSQAMQADIEKCGRLISGLIRANEKRTVS
ncbi:MAG: four helix bundle protein [Verrucomicrobia bacterium]|nr:four helix bundle protein [Verrucomicrobiota bacterium]